MHAENLVVNQGRNRHAVEHVLKLFPEPDTVPIFALVIKPVDSVDLAALVVTPQQEEVLLELYFVSQQKNDGLERLLATVHVVTEEQVVSFRWETAILEQTQ